MESFNIVISDWNSSLILVYPNYFNSFFKIVEMNIPKIQTAYSRVRKDLIVTKFQHGNSDFHDLYFERIISIGALLSIASGSSGPEFKTFFKFSVIYRCNGLADLNFDYFNPSIIYKNHMTSQESVDFLKHIVNYRLLEHDLPLNCYDFRKHMSKISKLRPNQECYRNSTIKNLARFEQETFLLPHLGYYTSRDCLPCVNNIALIKIFIGIYLSKSYEIKQPDIAKHNKLSEIIKNILSRPIWSENNKILKK